MQEVLHPEKVNQEDAQEADIDEVSLIQFFFCILLNKTLM